MNATQWFIIIGILLIFVWGCWSVFDIMKQAEKDWNTLYALEKRAKEVETKEEIEILHKDLQGVKISNPHIKPRLMHIDGYLRGLYKQF
jgi:hypothetical protein